jgi:hypothetical protein
MSSQTGHTKCWSIPEFDHLELFRAKAIHYSYARHSHPSYSIGIIEAGVGGNRYRGSAYLAPPQSIILMNPEEAHTGYSAEGLPLTYRMLYPSVAIVQQIASESQIREFPHFKDAVVQNDLLAKNILSLNVAPEQSQDWLKQQSLFVTVLSALLAHTHIISSIRYGKEHRAVSLIKEYLHDNFGSNISLENLTRLTGLNRSYLIRVFSQTVGMPPYTDILHQYK